MSCYQANERCYYARLGAHQWGVRHWDPRVRAWREGETERTRAAARETVRDCRLDACGPGAGCRSLGLARLRDGASR